MTTGGKLVTLVLSMVVLYAGQSAALAGSCTKTTRSMGFFDKWIPSARTTVHNESTSMTLKVNIYRGDDLKQTMYIKPGQNVSELTKFAEQGGGGIVRAEIIPTAGATTTADCYYRIRYVNDSGKMTWELRDGDTAVCVVGNDVKVVCEKSFNKDKLRFNTDFRVKNP